MFQERSTSILTLHWARNGVLAAILGVAFLVAACGGGNGDLGPGWTTAALLEEANGYVGRPKVVVDADNNATVVWSQIDGPSHRSIYSRRYSAAGTLSGVVALSDSGIDVMGPEIGVDGAGNVFAVWSQYDTGGTTSIQSSTYSQGSGLWSAPSALVSDAAAWDSPRVAVDADGNATVVWIQVDADSNFEVYACRFTATDPCVPVRLAHVDAIGSAGSVDVAAGPGGRAMAVWTVDEEGSGAARTWAGYFNGLGWSMVNIDAGLGNSGYPDVAFDADGNAMVVWKERTGDDFAGTPYFIRSRRYLAASGWEADYGTLGNGGEGSAGAPQVAFDSSGDAVMVWGVDRGAVDARLRFSRYTASGWGEAAYIDGGGWNFEAVLTIDGSDNITVAWESTADHSTYTLGANRYQPVVGWGGATTISAANQGFPGGVSVASDSRGHAIAVWQQEDAGGFNANAWFSVYQ